MSKQRRKMNILFSCVGRRVSLVEAFRKASRSLRMDPVIIGVDQTELSPAMQICDRQHVVRPVRENGYVDQLLRIVSRQHIQLLVPTVDLDLQVFAENRERFERLGCCVLISSPEVVQICQDKRKTFAFLSRNGFATPDTMTLATALRKKRIKYPRFLKPWDGYASRGNAVVHNRRQLSVIGRTVPNCIVQEYIPGQEYTCDAYVDFEMRVRCVVPRERLEVRSGEVSKGRIVKNKLIMETTARLVETLGAGPGVITIQLIVGKDGVMRFIEVNPRFGGGAPLSIHAGANFPKWILQELTGKQPRIGFDDFRDGLTMLRYDAEVWMGGK